MPGAHSSTGHTFKGHGPRNNLEALLAVGLLLGIFVLSYFIIQSYNHSPSGLKHSSIAADKVRTHIEHHHHWKQHSTEIEFHDIQTLANGQFKTRVVYQHKNIQGEMIFVIRPPEANDDVWRILEAQ